MFEQARERGYMSEEEALSRVQSHWFSLYAAYLVVLVTYVVTENPIFTWQHLATFATYGLFGLFLFRNDNVLDPFVTRFNVIQMLAILVAAWYKANHVSMEFHKSQIVLFGMVCLANAFVCRFFPERNICIIVQLLASLWTFLLYGFEYVDAGLALLTLGNILYATKRYLQ